MTISEQTSTGPSGLPHGGQLVDRRLDAEEAATLAPGRLPSLPLTAAEAADLRALATGAYSPLAGFMGAKEHESVTESMRLPDGTLWPIPVCLGIPDGVRVDDGRLALRDEAGRLLGVLEVTEVFERDRRAEAELVYGTTDPDHPGVARVLGVGGAVDELGLGLAVAFEHLGDLQHPQQPAGLVAQGQAAVGDPDPVGDAQAHRDRPQGAVGQAHLLGDRLVLLGPHEPDQGAVGAGGQGAQVGRLGRGQRQRRQRAGRKVGRLLGVQAPVDQLPAVWQAAARSGQRLLADGHGCSS